jgi:hypothetical protein
MTADEENGMPAIHLHSFIVRHLRAPHVMKNAATR